MMEFQVWRLKFQITEMAQREREDVVWGERVHEVHSTVGQGVG